MFGVCRGFQEMNVAFGGTLWQKVHEVPGLTDHREDKDEPLEVQYGPAHEVELVAWRRAAPARRQRSHPGELAALAGRADSSARALEIEARAPDGLVEAFRVDDARDFALAVQWHPEWQVMSNPFSHALFAAFGAAARERAQGKRS